MFLSEASHKPSMARLRRYAIRVDGFVSVAAPLRRSPHSRHEHRPTSRQAPEQSALSQGIETNARARTPCPRESTLARTGSSRSHP